MENKKRLEALAESTPICCHETYMNFLHAILAYLKDANSSPKQQKQDLAKIEELAVELKKELPTPHQKQGVSIDKQIDQVVQLAREYYPSEGDSPELSKALEDLNQTMQYHYGVS